MSKSIDVVHSVIRITNDLFFELLLFGLLVIWITRYLDYSLFGLLVIWITRYSNSLSSDRPGDEATTVVVILRRGDEAPDRGGLPYDS